METERTDKAELIQMVIAIGAQWTPLELEIDKRVVGVGGVCTKKDPRKGSTRTHLSHQNKTRPRQEIEKVNGHNQIHIS